ncbi:hypothetical protein [Chryseobacterium limigenitum]|uniref:Uncharacterized protein n=1 Tax=Chryseobacterium limigenitum TaxID=1612149 RepID=A0A1K2ISK3_9FLAO|nr:hypothetical protein [Chryseobacterium limigenitum]SFZ95234.1 hypothetical protein SAMN05216324_1099 [Chryseobacterium limigenitum]
MQSEQYEVRIILLDYLTSNTRQDFKRRLRLKYSEKQCEILMEKLDSFSSNCNKNSLLLSFPYIWDKIKEEAISMTRDEAAELLWNKGYQKLGLSKKQLGEICFSWLVVEKKFLEFKKEQLLETSKNKQQNNNLEHER